MPLHKFHKFHKFLHKKLRVPRWAGYSSLSAAKAVLHPNEHRLRRQAAKEIIAATSDAAAISRLEGYRFFGPDDYPGVQDVIDYCTKVYQESRETFSPEFFVKNPKKRFLLHILKGADFCEHPALMRFMVSRPILDAATVYFQSVPQIAGATLCWSPENETARSSQLFHLDYEDLSQLKVFINIFETREDQGPLTFIPADISDQIQKPIGPAVGRFDDERIYEAGGRDRALKLVGPPGSGAFVDTSRCLHYGSRFNKRNRLVLIIQFLTFHSPYKSKDHFHVPPDTMDLELDPVQKLALGLRYGAGWRR